MFTLSGNISMVLRAKLSLFFLFAYPLGLLARSGQEMCIYIPNTQQTGFMFIAYLNRTYTQKNYYIQKYAKC